MRDIFRGGIIRQYIASALWSSNDDAGDPLDDGRDHTDVDPATVQTMRDECAAFFRANRRQLRETSGDLGQHAHDFWLTRNRHGVGFWDRGYGPIGETLTQAAQVYGEVDLFVGDDNLVRQS